MEETPVATKKSTKPSRSPLFGLFLFAVFTFVLCSVAYYFWQFYWQPAQTKHDSSYTDLSDKIERNSSQLTILSDQVSLLRREGLMMRDSLSALARLTEQYKLEDGALRFEEKGGSLRLVLAEAELLLAAAIGELILFKDEGAALDYLELALSVLSEEQASELRSVENALKKDLKALRDEQALSSNGSVVSLAALRTEIDHLLSAAPYCFSDSPSKKFVPIREEGKKKGFLEAVWNDLQGLLEVREIGASQDLMLLDARKELVFLVVDMELANASAATILGKLDELKVATNSLVRLLKNHCDTSNDRVVSAIENLNGYRNLNSTNRGMPIRSSIDAIRVLRKSLVANKKRGF